MADATTPTPHEQPSHSAAADERQRRATPGKVVEEADAAYRQAELDIHRLAHHFHRWLYGDLREEAVAETEAFVWKRFCKLVARGRDPLTQVPRIVDLAARRVRAGHRFAGKIDDRDALSPVATKRRGYLIRSLSAGKDELAGEVRNGLRSRAPEPAEEAIRNADWEAFLKSLPDEKYRDLAVGLLEGFTLEEIGEQRGVSKQAAREMAVRLRKRYEAFYGTDRER